MYFVKYFLAFWSWWLVIGFFSLQSFSVGKKKKKKKTNEKLHLSNITKQFNLFSSQMCLKEKKKIE